MSDPATEADIKWAVGNAKRLERELLSMTEDARRKTELAVELKRDNDRLRAIVADACEVLRHYDLPEHAFHYERVLRGEVPLTVQQTAGAKEEA